MMKELLFKNDLLEAVIRNVKTVTSRLNSDLRVNDVVYVTDSYKDDHYADIDIFCIVTDVQKKRIADVDYVAESMSSTQELIDVLNNIYYRMLKRVDREFNIDDTMTVISFQKVITRR